MTATIRIGTRGSALAMVQTSAVASALARHVGPIELILIVTAGDARRPDSEPGEGAFVGSIEASLRAGEIDVAVHSAKDLPTDRDGDRDLAVVAFLPRADPRDALVTREGRATLATLPTGASVGTDSPRRAGFVLAQRPDLQMRPLAGNIDTRLRRLDEGEVDALVLAVAGLSRLGCADRVDQPLDPALVPPAAGQGALAVQVRRKDRATAAAGRKLDDPNTRTAVETERSVLAAVGGGCRTGVGVLASLDGDQMSLLAARVKPDGTGWRLIGLSGMRIEANLLAKAVARELAL